jgi:hypothetical protein
LLFDVKKARFQTIDVPTLQAASEKERYPIFESIVGPKPHECIVTVADQGGHLHTFCILTQPFARESNKCLSNLGWKWTGPVLVMKMGLYVDFVGLRTLDRDHGFDALKK